MAKTKKISVSEFEKVMKDNYATVETFNWYGNEVVVIKTLSINDMMQFVSNVVSGCFSSDGNVYMPEVKDFFIKFNILEMYANFAMPKNASSRYDLVYRTDAVESVIARINHNQFDEILDSIDKKIDSIVQSNSNLIAAKMNDIVSAFEILQNKTAAVFENISPEDIKAISKASEEGYLDSGKIVRAYMDSKRESADGQY